MQRLIDFRDEKEAGRWRAIHDQVMGGCSEGGVNCRDGVAVFAGTLSLENNGGFASVRREPEPLSLGGASGIRLEARGDGRRYQLRLRMDRAVDGITYRAVFGTEEAEWIELALPWARFEPVFRGRVVNAPPLEPGAIQQVGLMTADKQPGDFCLEIRTIARY